MGKAARAACILTPWLLTAASLALLLLLEISGWGSHGTLNDLYFVKANFTGLSVSSATSLDNTTTLTSALENARDNDLIAHVYEIHIWNYCSSNSSNGNIDYCSPRHKDYYFDPIAVWHLNDTANGRQGPNGVPETIRNNTEALENDVFGKSGREALDAYRHVAEWMFIAYAIAFWSTVATLVVGVFALFSRIGSFFTWIFAIISTIFTVGAVITSTVLFITIVNVLHTVFEPYNIQVTLGQQAINLSCIAAACSILATLFWLFSICCCSGRSNPHHKSNKGGLWGSEKGQGYAAGPGMRGYLNGMGIGNGPGRGRSLRVEKTGAGQGAYERVASPFLEPNSKFQQQELDTHPADRSGDISYSDRVPLTDYPSTKASPFLQPNHGQDADAGEFPLNTGYAPPQGPPPQQSSGGAYEPYRHA